MTDPILKVENLSKRFGKLIAVDNVSFEIMPGETFALVGESGSGKTTIGRTILRLTGATGGKVIFEGRNLLTLKERELRAIRPGIQMIFQDPYSSLDPLYSIGKTLREAVHEHRIVEKKDEEEYVKSVMEECGLRRDMYDKLPDDFSGGERQRIAIARVMALQPRLIIADEPVSALDVSVEAQILSLMLRLKEEKNLSYLFISHDMNVIRLLSDRIGVMYHGKLVEVAGKDELLSNPMHPYTRLLLKLDQRIECNALPEDQETCGCPFYSRCPVRMDRCRMEMPEERNLDGHRIRCFSL